MGDSTLWTILSDSLGEAWSQPGVRRGSVSITMMGDTLSECRSEDSTVRCLLRESDPAPTDPNLYRRTARFNITNLQGGVEFDGLGVSATVLHWGGEEKEERWKDHESCAPWW